MLGCYRNTIFTFNTLAKKGVYPDKVISFNEILPI